MITKIVKWIGIMLGSLLVLAAVVGGIFNARANVRLTKKYEVLY